MAVSQNAESRRPFPIMTPDEFFRGARLAQRLYDALDEEMGRLGRTSVRVSKSQVAFRRKKNVAVVWMPGKYLEQDDIAPLVLTLSLARKDDSPRWKEVVRTSPNRFTHHLELRRLADIDDQVKGWLHEAWESAA